MPWSSRVTQFSEMHDTIAGQFVNGHRHFWKVSNAPWNRRTQIRSWPDGLGQVCRLSPLKPGNDATGYQSHGDDLDSGGRDCHGDVTVNAGYPEDYFEALIC